MAVDEVVLPASQAALKVVEAGSVRLESNAPLPPLEPGHVMVRTKCVAINPFDWKSLDMSPAPGSTIGCDVSGEVVAVATESSGRFQVGDRVLGASKGNDAEHSDNGAFAEYVSVQEIFLWKMKADMTFEQAATMGVALGTIGLALFHCLKVPLPLDLGQKGTGDFVFIYGGGTATGTLAIQAVALSGLRPITTSSPKHFDRLKSLGAVACWDYKSPTCATEIRSFTNDSLTMALDCITDSASMSICYTALGKEGGKYIGLDQFPIRNHTRRDVRPDWIIAWTMSGQPVKWKKPYRRDAKPKHKAFGHIWNPIAQKLLDAGVLVTHPFEVRSGGLKSGVPDGLDRVRLGTAAGKKLVYPIASKELIR